VTRPIRILFFKPGLEWPFQSGHDIHTFHMMRGLHDCGARIGLVTERQPSREVLDRLPLDLEAVLDGSAPAGNTGALNLRRLEARFQSYWGVPRSHVESMRAYAKDFRADVVIVSGLGVLPLVSGIEDAVRIWYAADEWVLHHLSQVRLTDRDSWSNLREAAIKGLYERAFKHRLDRAWAVSDADGRALRWFAGVPSVDVLPNGIDGDFYQPDRSNEQAGTAVFWGRLDFGPNIQALDWFCKRVWPDVRRARADARFTIIGFKATPEVTALAGIPGVTIMPDVPDLRPEVARSQAVVLPFVSGRGIKNKLLEAAAMGKAIIGTPHALGGMKGSPPIWTSPNAAGWPALLSRLWNEPETRHALGDQAREWVLREHTWTAAARLAMAGIEDSLRTRTRAS
jgi:polysaccharide biosynthesis protein PslH